MYMYIYREGNKRDTIDNDIFNEENTVPKKGEKSDINTTEKSKRRASLHKQDRKLESSIAAGTLLKPSLKQQNSNADMLNDKDDEDRKTSFISGFTSNDKKSLMASNTIKNSQKSDYVAPGGMISKAIKGKEGKIVPGVVRMTVKFDLPDYIEEEDYRPDEDFKTEVHFS